MEKIVKPQFIFKASQTAYKTLAKEYNHGKNLGSQLRSSHLSLINQLFVFIQSDMRRHVYVFRDTQPIDNHQDTMVKTNTVSLGKLSSQNPDTIRRQLNRLIKAKVITKKVNHGHNRDFDLYINHELVIILDLENTTRIVSSKYYNNENRDLENAQTESFDLNNLLNEPFNNQLILPWDVDKSVGQKSGVDISTDTRSEHFETNTPKRRQAQKEKSNKYRLNIFERQRLAEENEILPEKLTINGSFQTKQSPNRWAKKQKDMSLQRYKKLMAQWLLSYALAALWQGRTIYKAEYEKAFNYIEAFYFNDLRTYEAFEKKENELRWRIDAVARYMKRNSYEMSLYPFKYFDLSNHTSGFIKTKAWFKKDQLYQKQKQLKNQRIKDIQKLDKAIKRYCENPTIEEYQKQERFVLNNIAHLKTEYYQYFNQQ